VLPAENRIQRLLLHRPFHNRACQHLPKGRVLGNSLQDIAHILFHRLHGLLFPGKLQGGFGIANGCSGMVHDPV